MIAGESFTCGLWSYFDLPLSERLALAAALGFGVPLSVTGPLSQEMLADLEIESNLQALAQDGPYQEQVISRLHTPSATLSFYQQLFEDRLDRPDLQEARLERIAALALDSLEAAPEWPWPLEGLAEKVNSRGELCCGEEVREALEPMLPSGAFDEETVRLPAGCPLPRPGLLTGAVRDLRDLVDGGENNVRRWTTPEPGVPRDRVFHDIAGLPPEMTPGLSARIVEAANARLTAAAVDPAALREEEREELVEMVFLGMQGNDLEGDEIDPALLLPLRDAGLRYGLGYALSRASGLQRNLWALRLMIAWTLRDELGMPLKVAAEETGLSTRTIQKWMDGPERRTKEKRVARSLEQALRRLLQMPEFRELPEEQRPDIQLRRNIVQFLKSQPLGRPMKVWRIQTHLRRVHGRSVSTLFLKQVLLRMVETEQLDYCLQEGEPLFKARASSSNLVPGDCTERLDNVLLLYRWYLYCHAHLGDPVRQARVDRRVVLVRRAEVDTLFTEIREQIRTLVREAQEPLPRLPASYRGGFLLTWRRAWPVPGKLSPLHFRQRRRKKQ